MLPTVAAAVLVLLNLLGFSRADDSGNDPYLQYRPPFVRSLPIQILFTGIVLALVVVLFIHLLFTAQYHWPLAPVNYVLQLSAVITLLISLIATLHVVLSETVIESQRWPYMLSYIAVNVPPLDVQTTTLNDWSTAEKATWLAMNAGTSGLIQITHIHFLSLLYPSRLERRLIFTLLAPLAIVAAVMQLIPVQGIASQTMAIAIAIAVRNVCNATLSLLFTFALFIWGFLLNRRQAWRTDGGTAIFGGAALSLAVCSTALNFFYVDREQEYVWLPSLMWAVVLWQSFLGWWWWVGAGSGGRLLGEAQGVEERLHQQEKRELRRREAKERRSATRLRARNALKSVTSAFGASRYLDSDDDHEQTTVVAATNTNSLTTSRRRRRRDPQTEHSDQDDINDKLDSLQSTNPSSPSKSQSPWPGFLSNWYASLSRAHREAAQVQAAARVERIKGLGTRHPISRGGWGLGSFGRQRRLSSSTRTDEEVETSPHCASLRRIRSDATLCSRIESTYNQASTATSTSSHHSPTFSASSSSSHPSPPQAVHVQPPWANQREQQRSMWWWGPLRRWRLQDTTVY